MVLVLVLDVDLKNGRMTNGLGNDFDECGRFSISSWLVDVALPQGNEINLKSTQFGRYEFRSIISIVSYKKPLRLTFGTSMCNI